MRKKNVGWQGFEDIKAVTAKGIRYLYFKTGQKKPSGNELLIPLPDPGSIEFGTRLSNLRAVKTKRSRRVVLFTIADAVNHYQHSRSWVKKTQSTQDAYASYLLRMLDAFTDNHGSWDALSVEPQHVLELLTDLGPGAQKTQLAVFRNVMRESRKIFKIPPDFDPSRGIEVDHEAVPHDSWPDWLVEKGLADPVMRLPIAMLYFTGQRIGAVIRMKWSDIEDGVIHVPPHKRSGDLYIPIHSKLAAILAEQPKSLTTILCGAYGRPLTTNALRPRIKTWVAEHGLPDLVPHGLRKNAMEALLEAGCTVAEVQGITDQSMRMVEHYARQISKRKMAGRAMRKWDAV
ncbi:MAG: site-specific integrase [Shewanella sp.]